MSTRLVRFLDFDRGSLLLLTEDFKLETGWTERVRPDFCWWMMEEKGVVGYSLDRLQEGPPDLDFLVTLSFRVVAPQLRLFNAGVNDVAATAYTCFVEQKLESNVSSHYEHALDLAQNSRSIDDFILEFQHWSLLYQLYGHVDGLYWMGVSCINLGLNADAVRWLEKFLECFGDHAWAHCHLGQAHFNLGNRKAARMHWEVAVCLDTRSHEDTGAARLLARLKR